MIAQRCRRSDHHAVRLPPARQGASVSSFALDDDWCPVGGCIIILIVCVGDSGGGGGGGIMTLLPPCSRNPLGPIPMLVFVRSLTLVSTGPTRPNRWE